MDGRTHLVRHHPAACVPGELEPVEPGVYILLGSTEEEREALVLDVELESAVGLGAERGEGQQNIVLADPPLRSAVRRVKNGSDPGVQDVNLNGV